jgi:hypothetical protein
MTTDLNTYSHGGSNLPDRAASGPISAISQAIGQGKYDRALGRINYQLGAEVARTTATAQAAAVKVQALAHLGIQGVVAAGLLSDAAVDVARRSPHAAPLLDRIYGAAGGGVVRVIEDAADRLVR